MAVSVRVPNVLRKHTDGNATVEGSGDTVSALLSDLADRHPGLTTAITDDAGALAGFINVYLNDEDIRFIDGPQTELRDGDELSLLPAVAGGSRRVGMAGGSRRVGMAGGSRRVGMAGGSRRIGTAGGDR